MAFGNGITLASPQGFRRHPSAAAPPYCLSPDGEEHFPVIARKGPRHGCDAAPTLTSEDLRAVAARTLVVVGDDDTVSLEHTIALYRGIPDSELSIIPGASHLLIIEKPNEVYSLTAQFLTTQPTPTLMPVRRPRRPETQTARRRPAARPHHQGGGIAAGGNTTFGFPARFTGANPTPTLNCSAG